MIGWQQDFRETKIPASAWGAGTFCMRAHEPSQLQCPVRDRPPECGVMLDEEQRGAALL